MATTRLPFFEKADAKTETQEFVDAALQITGNIQVLFQFNTFFWLFQICIKNARPIFFSGCSYILPPPASASCLYTCYVMRLKFASVLSVMYRSINCFHRQRRRIRTRSREEGWRTGGRRSPNWVLTTRRLEARVGRISTWSDSSNRDLLTWVTNATMLKSHEKCLLIFFRFWEYEGSGHAAAVDVSEAGHHRQPGRQAGLLHAPAQGKTTVRKSSYNSKCYFY